MRRTSKRGFTLVEILIVVSILGILAALVVPQFSSAADSSRENSAKVTIYRIRQQLELYKQQHAGQWPSLANFEAQMVQATNLDGDTAAPGTPGYPFGPYLQSLPDNPSTNTNTVTGGEPGTSAWYYDPATGDFRANHSAEAREY